MHEGARDIDGSVHLPILYTHACWQIRPGERADGRERQGAQLRPAGLGGVVQVGGWVGEFVYVLDVYGLSHAHNVRPRC